MLSLSDSGFSFTLKLELERKLELNLNSFKSSRFPKSGFFSDYNASWADGFWVKMVEILLIPTIFAWNDRVWAAWLEQTP